MVPSLLPSRRGALVAACLVLTQGCASGGPRADVFDTPRADSVVLLAAGDIGDCTVESDEATARIIDEHPSATVLALGDLAYQRGTETEFRSCYGPSWGRHRERTRPVPGNHETYFDPSMDPYFDFFDEAAGPRPSGRYSFDLGAWHVVALNTNCWEEPDLCATAGSEQAAWLRDDLARSRARCTLAMWHFPRWSSKRDYESVWLEDLVGILYENGVDVLLVGHGHHYERFAPQDPEGRADRVRGLRQFVVGTGGAPLYAFEGEAPNSEVRNDHTHGVLRLVLREGSYEWAFLPVAGSSWSDRGGESCR